MKLSKREQFLVCLALTAAVWAVAFRLSIAPSYGQYARNVELIRERGIEQEQMRQGLDSLPVLKGHLDEMTEQEEGEGFFFHDIDDSYMDENLQEMAGQAGLVIRRMSIGSPSPMEMQAQDELTAKSAKDAVGQDASSEDDAHEPDIWETVITMEVEGTDAESIMSFADEIKKEPKSLSLTFVDMAREKGSPDGGSMKGIMEVRYYHGKIR